MSNKPIYDKVILKVSGEALAGDKNFGIDEETLIGIAKEIKEVSALGSRRWQFLARKNKSADG